MHVSFLRLPSHNAHGQSSSSTSCMEPNPRVALEEAHPSISCRKDRERESDSNFWGIQEVLVEVGGQICEPQSELNEQVTTVVSLAVFLPFAFSGAELCSIQFENYFSEEI